VHGYRGDDCNGGVQCYPPVRRPVNSDIRNFGFDFMAGPLAHRLYSSNPGLFLHRSCVNEYATTAWCLGCFSAVAAFLLDAAEFCTDRCGKRLSFSNPSECQGR